MSLSTTRTILETRRDTLATELSNLGAMGPNFSLDGVSIDWLAYATRLREEILAITDTLEKLAGPCLVYTQGV